MIAGGIFVLSGLAVANVGATAAVSFGLAAVVASLTALAYAEFAAIHTVDGGSYAHFADLLLLIGLLFVNVALIQSRRREPNRERRFRVPGVPWIPLVAVGSNLSLLANLEASSMMLGLLAVIVGIVFWFGVLE